MTTDVKVPTLGESITEGTLAQWLKKPGDAVAADEPIASLETDKVTVEVPSPAAGTLAETLVNEGDTVEVGAVIARIGEGGAPSAAPAEKAAAATTNPAGAGETPQLKSDDHAPVADAPTAEDHITTLSPAVRRAVLEHHVDPSTIRGTGKDGRLFERLDRRLRRVEPEVDVVELGNRPVRPCPARPGFRFELSRDVVHMFTLPGAGRGPGSAKPTSNKLG
jgi:2-oxoglutarate dehydrogenase E2 component (dihydrolipoamide succinyltransferase)